MNSNNFFESLQKGFHVTLGATTSLVESIQDSQKRERNLTLLRGDLNSLVQEWEEKGVTTELEARNFVDSVLGQQSNLGSNPGTGIPGEPISTTTPIAPPDVQLELQELTAQIAAIRTELENLRNPDSGL